jgi:phage terminase large subunit GpA-like protein
MARLTNLALSFFRPPENLNIWQWAERYRFLAKGVSAKSLQGPTPYSTSYAPHQRACQESFTDPQVQITALVQASQIGGKTEMFNNCLGYHMHHSPRNAIVMYPTEDGAKKFSKKKFTPMAEATPVLRDLLRPARSRDSGNTILIKEFTGGSIYFIGANSPTSLRGASGEILLADEIDANEPDAAGEGDPVELLWKRGESFPRVVKVVASTPTTAARDEKGISLSPIWSIFEASDQQYWFVPCPKCGQFQRLLWAQIVWPKDSAGKNLTSQAELICSNEKCGASLNDRDRQRMYYEGHWQPTAPFDGIRGFHLSGIYCPWPALKGFKNRLHQMAEEFVRANRKGAYALRVWVNTFLCEPFAEENEKPFDPLQITERLENYTPDTLPVGVVLLFCAVDVQKDRLELEVIGLGLDEETWGVEYVKLFGDTEQDEVWQNLEEQLHKKYHREDKVELTIKAAAIDTQYHGPAVRRFVKKSAMRQGEVGYPGLYLMQGKGNPGPLLVVRRRNKQYRLNLWSVETKQAKDTIFSRLRVTDPGPRYLHFPKGHGYGEEYARGLASEVIKRHRERGRTIETYEKITSSTRNEPLDLRVYFLAAVDIVRANLSAIARRHTPAAESSPAATREYELKPPPEPPKPAPPPKPKWRPKPAGSMGFIGKWKK